MKKIFLIAMTLTICLSPILLAKPKEENYKQADTFILKGMIDNKYPITMYLTIDKDDNVKGKYYYDNVRKYIEITGTSTQNALALEEKIYNSSKDEYDITGEFEGTFDSKNIIYSGTWINPKTKKQMPFVLKKTSIYKINHIETFKYSYESDKVNLGYSEIYPKLVNYKNRKGINNINKYFEVDKSIIDSLYEDFDEYYQGETLDYEKLYGYHRETIFHYEDENIISFVRTSFRFARGMAKPNWVVDCFVFDIKTGKLLNKNIDDLIIDKNNPKLLSLIRHNLGGFPDSMIEEIRLSDNYYIDVEGIHFFDVPYPAMEYSLSFSFDELRPFIKKSSSYWYLFK